MKMRKIALGFAALTATGVVCILQPPLAQADNTDEYMQWLLQHGVTNLPNGNSVLAQGQQECQGLRNGQSEMTLIGQLEGQMGRAQADDIVVAAHRYLCSGA